MSIRLFEPLVEESRQHPNFRTIMRPGNGFALDVLSDWARGFEDRDGKFVEEFQTTFNSAFWELYLYAVFKKYGLAVDFSHARPDFCIPESGLVVEAAVASNAKDEEPEHARRGKEPPPDLNAFNFKSILRLSNRETQEVHAVVCTTRSREGTELRHCCDKLRSPLQFRGVPATHRGRSARLLRRRGTTYRDERARRPP